MIPDNAIEITNCDFLGNKSPENDSSNKLSGGAVYFKYDTTSAENRKFKFHINNCTFSNNIASTKGGAICISIEKNEITHPIVINNCVFEQNQASTTNEVQGFGSDICYTHKLSSYRLQLMEVEYDSSLKVNQCNFSNSISKYRGGSIYISITNSQATKSIEVERCLFNEIKSPFGGSVNIQSNNPSILFNICECTFKGESSVFFNGIAGNVKQCRFNNIKNAIPIYYESNSLEETNEDNSFTIEKCTFYQSNEIYSLIFFVPKFSSHFAFVDNEINILNKKTFVFNCYSDSKLEGTWKFRRNSISPNDERIINSENATKIHFLASCFKGFLCTSQQQPGFECEKNKHCSVNGDDQPSLSYIDISDSNFNGIKDEEAKGGGAIYLLNYGVVCNNAQFIECSSEKEGGGAVYIHLNKIIDSLVSFTSVAFTKCSAVYGGAVYVYSDQEDNFVFFNSCKFKQNKAKEKEESNRKSLFGGSAIYLTVKNGEVDNCDFINNFDNSIKVSNEYENSVRSTKELKSFISIDKCSFEAEFNSSSSIFYSHLSKKEIQIDVKNCFFKGKIKKDSYHIDGFSLLTKGKISCFNFKSCKFGTGMANSINP